MKTKQVGDFVKGRWRDAFGRRKPLIHQLLVLRMALSILMIPTGAVAKNNAAPPAAPSASAAAAPKSVARLTPETARAIETALSTLFRMQGADGAYEFPEPLRAFERFPLIASAALDAYQSTGNVPALSQSAYSVARYYGWLFASQDHDGNGLVETGAPWAGKAGHAEDPAYNALVAIDLTRLARIQLALRRTLPALNEYDGARNMERALVTSSFDADGLFFFARDPATGEAVKTVHPIAALPVSFPDVLGNNHIEKVAAQVARWAGGSAARAGAEGEPDADADAVENLAAVDVLRTARQKSLAAARDASNWDEPGLVARYARERARFDTPLVDLTLPLDLFAAIVRNSHRFEDADVVRIERAVAVVGTLIDPTAPSAGKVDGDTADRAIRDVFAGVSQMRDQLRAGSFFSDDDKREFPGTDATLAAQRMVDDVVAAARRAESRRFEMRFAPSGLQISATLTADDAVEGENVTLRWVLSTRTPQVWKSVSAGVAGGAVSTVSPTSPVRIGAAGARFSTRYALRGSIGAVAVIPFTLEIEDSAGARYRYHANRSVYTHPAVDVAARFPQGRTVRGGVVPIRIDLRRHSRSSVDVQYFWFSPAGLKVREGNTGRVRFDTGDSTGVTLNVEIPSPCRPGTFPFTLKFFSTGRDAGTIASSLFKPYAWTYAGTFSGEGIERPYPPEQGVNLLQSYDGATERVVWRVVPLSACGSRGEITLRNLAVEIGVHYLYTVVACAYETDIEVRLASNRPAGLFINGRRVAVTKGTATDSTSATVHLNADKNHVLIKVAGDAGARVWFALGNDDILATDEFDNNLMDLAGGYREISARELSGGSSTHESRRLVTLRYQNVEAQSVAVVGSFNGWSPDASPMAKKDGVWELTLSLAPGRYAYRFLLDQRKQVLDPSSRREEPDGYGGKNSVLVVEK